MYNIYKVISGTFGQIAAGCHSSENVELLAIMPEQELAEKTAIAIASERLGHGNRDTMKCKNRRGYEEFIVGHGSTSYILVTPEVKYSQTDIDSQNLAYQQQF